MVVSDSFVFLQSFFCLFKLQVLLLALSASSLSAGAIADTQDHILQGFVSKRSPVKLQRPGSAETFANANSNSNSNSKSVSSISPIKPRLILPEKFLDTFKQFEKAKKESTGDKLSEKELRCLSKYEICLVLDCSASMNKKLDDFLITSRESRWQWCENQASSLCRQIESHFPEGITVIPFSDRAQRFSKVKASELETIFKSTYPEGMTMLDHALELEFEHFLNERPQAKAKQKALLITVITDGAPSAPQRIADQISELASKTKRGELKILFFMIGDDPMAAAFIDYLQKQGLSRINSAGNTDIVSSLPFSELLRLGLSRSLLAHLMVGGEKKAEK